MDSGKKNGSWRDQDEFDRTEVISVVCALFVRGFRVKQILDVIERDYPHIKLNRMDIYALVREAGKRGWLRFRPPQHWRWTKMIEDKCPSLRNVRVVHTASARDVAHAGAESLLRLVKGTYRASGRREVHIGFSGGHATRALVRVFADLVFEPAEDLPEAIVIHAMAAGFDPRDPTTDPNTFCAYFVNGSLNDIEVRFLGFAAPSLVKPADIVALSDLPAIKEAFAAVANLDIIVASGSCWLDPHGALRNLMYSIPDCKSVLEDEGCVADVLWRPLSENGPIETETSVRAMTLVELSELTGLIQRGKHVLLTVGPCGLCHAPKGGLLSCLLKQRRPLMTDLVVDSRTVAEMVRLERRAMVAN